MQVPYFSSARHAATPRRRCPPLARIARAFMAASALSVASLVAASDARAATFYLSPSGSDTSAGTAPSAAWRSLERASKVRLRPGDAVLLQAGRQHQGRLFIGADDQGTAAEPIVVGSYGTGRATIVGADRPGIDVYNVAGVTVKDIKVKGPGRMRTNAVGISFYTDLANPVLLPGITVRRVEVSGFSRGLAIGSWGTRAGYRDVQISDVEAHHNTRDGIITYAQYPRTHRNVRIKRSAAHHNLGDPTLTQNSGSGIILGSTTRGRIDHSRAWRNGGLNTSNEGGVGIWTYDSKAVVIEHNESWANKTGGSADGGGVDIDQRTSKSVLQFNYSHDNDGPGLMSANPPDSNDMRDNVIRYNVSENDGRKNRAGGILVWRRSLNLRVCGNRVVIPPSQSRTAVAVDLYHLPAASASTRPVLFEHNTITTRSGAPLVQETNAAAGARFRGNAYRTFGGAFRVLWRGTTHRSLNSWRSTGQESPAVGKRRAGRLSPPRGSECGPPPR